MTRFILLLFLATIVLCCKKSTKPVVCETTTASITGSYHLTKYERVIYATGIPQDMTNTLSACELNAVYKLNADSTAIYTENGSCTGSGTGNWRLYNGSSFVFNFKSGNGMRLNTGMFNSWDCTNLVLMTAYPSTISNDRYTLTRF